VHSVYVTDSSDRNARAGSPDTVKVEVFEPRFARLLRAGRHESGQNHVTRRSQDDGTWRGTIGVRISIKAEQPPPAAHTLGLIGRNRFAEVLHASRGE